MFAFGSGVIGGGLVPPPRLIAPPAPRPPALLQPFQFFIPEGLQQGSAPGMTWGAIQVPALTVSQVPNFIGDLGNRIQGDPALQFTLGFLFAYLVLDNNAQGPWQAQTGYPLVGAPGAPPGLSLFAHNPVEDVFSVSYLPALYLFRDDKAGGEIVHEADDWEVEESTWTLLWVMPSPASGQDVQRQYRQYANQVVKACAAALSIGLTPSWVMPGDTDPGCHFRGSYLGFFTNVMRQRITGWKRTKIASKPSNMGAVLEFPAVEMKMLVREKTQADLRAPMYFPLGPLDLSIYNQFGLRLEHEIVQDRPTGGDIVIVPQTAVPPAEPPSNSGGTDDILNTVIVTNSMSPYTPTLPNTAMLVDASGGPVSILIPNLPANELGSVYEVSDYKQCSATNAISITPPSLMQMDDPTAPGAYLGNGVGCAFHRDGQTAKWRFDGASLFKFVAVGP